MKEIKDKDESNARSTKKRFWVMWTEEIGHSAEIRASSKEEALKLFHEYDDQILDTLSVRESEMIGEPVIGEVSECD